MCWRPLDSSYTYCYLFAAKRIISPTFIVLFVTLRELYGHALSFLYFSYITFSFFVFASLGNIRYDQKIPLVILFSTARGTAQGKEYKAKTKKKTLDAGRQKKIEHESKREGIFGLGKYLDAQQRLIEHKLRRKGIYGLQRYLDAKQKQIVHRLKREGIFGSERSHDTQQKQKKKQEQAKNRRHFRFGEIYLDARQRQIEQKPKREGIFDFQSYLDAQ